MPTPIQNIDDDFDNLLDDERYDDPTEQDDEEEWVKGECRIDCQICYGTGCTFCNDLGYNVKKIR